jgi:hypothetical protein
MLGKNKKKEGHDHEFIQEITSRNSNRISVIVHFAIRTGTSGISHTHQKVLL